MMLYRHHKGGLYDVLHEATESTNGREGRAVVVYRSQTTGKVHVRDAEEFHGPVEGDRPRFTRCPPRRLGIWCSLGFHAASEALRTEYEGEWEPGGPLHSTTLFHCPECGRNYWRRLY